MKVGKVALFFHYIFHCPKDVNIMRHIKIIEINKNYQSVIER